MKYKNKKNEKNKKLNFFSVNRCTVCIVTYTWKVQQIQWKHKNNNIKSAILQN